jgi:hypothetical protein
VLAIVPQTVPTFTTLLGEKNPTSHVLKPCAHFVRVVVLVGAKVRARTLEPERRHIRWFLSLARTKDIAHMSGKRRQD